MNLGTLIDQTMDRLAAPLTLADRGPLTRLQGQIDEELHALADVETVGGVLSPDQKRLFDDGVVAMRMITETHDGLGSSGRRDALADAERESTRQSQHENDRTRRFVQGLPTSGRTVTYMHDNSRADRQRGFHGLGDFLVSVADASTGSMTPDVRLIPLQAAMTQGSGPDGGWLLPPEYSSQVWTRMSQSGLNLMSMADVYPISGESLTLPASAETSRATGSRWGGVRAYWIEEGELMVESNPRLRRVKLEPHLLAAFVPVDNSLVRNSLALEKYLMQVMPDELLSMINIAMIEGDGVGKPVGILHSTATITVPKETTQQAGTITKTNIDTMWSRLAPDCRRHAVWLVHPDADVQLEALAPPGTLGATVLFLPSDQGMPSMALSPNQTLKGRPIIQTDLCQALSTEGDIILFDPSYYAMGIRGGMELESSIHVFFQSNRTAFRATVYADGQPWLSEPLIPYHGTNSLSAYVTLQTR